MEDRERSWVYLVDHGEAPNEYSPQIKAALAIYFASLISGEDVSVRDIAQVAGVSKDVLNHYIKGIKEKMKSIIEKEGETFEVLYTSIV